MQLATDSAGHHCWLLCGTLFVCLLAFGCSKQNVPAQPELASQSLEGALASWKSGEPPDALAKRTPPITMADFAWKAGQKLTDYRLVGDPTNDGVNLHFNVELTLANQQGTAAPEKVGYIVGTHPTITIFREFH